MAPSERPFDETHFWLYILFKSALKMQEMPFQRPKFQKFSGSPYNCVVTMAPPHWNPGYATVYTGLFQIILKPVFPKWN